MRARIRSAALSAFAERGYAGTTMADVAGRAGVATANLYRYYAGKDGLFNDLISDDFVAQFEAVIGRRVRTFGRLVRDADVADEMMDFWLAHRLQAAVVLARADGTRHAAVRRRLDDLSVNTLLDALPPGSVSDGDRGLIESIFDNTGRTIAAILQRNDTDTAIRSTITSFWRYQLAGLTALLRHLAESAHRPTAGADRDMLA